MYKLVNEKFYKNGGIFNTSEINYSNSIGVYDSNLSKFLDALFFFSKVSGMKFGHLLDVVNQINSAGLINHYYGLIKDKNDVISYSEFIRSAPANAYISKKSLALLCAIILEHKVSFTNARDGARFWEYFYETVRSEFFPECPSRLASYFSFKQPESLEFFKKNHRANGLKCKLNVEKCRVVFECDMIILDEIDHTFSYKEAEEIVKKYWRQEQSAHPVIEVLLQGEIKFLEEFR